MIYAPVAIHTLNRIEHLKRLIGSLQRNPFARFTELYIAVDYPPNEKYEYGHGKIVEYVNQGITGFAKVHTIFREKNYGPYLNGLSLKEHVLQEHDRLIVTEDDNEFSPSFLEYMDNALERYGDNMDIFAVAGYSYPISISDKDDSVIWQSASFSALGFGYWRRSFETVRNDIGPMVMKALSDRTTVRKLKEKSPHLFDWYVRSIILHDSAMWDDQNGRVLIIDVTMSIYMVLFGKSMVMPTVSLVRNWGHDGSGVHCGVDDSYEKEYISTATTYDLLDDHAKERLDDMNILITKHLNKGNRRKRDRFDAFYFGLYSCFGGAFTRVVYCTLKKIKTMRRRIMGYGEYAS